ncbi:Serine/threonine-protein kinase ifkB [Actinidia chinensis var. chinensis]|uniref:Serine/threonine-protein kinase ifkB n=1 Tax=Actinidia chinensis var. chinensis TaxID=1590841 RepID=A0A2R6RDV6_ACTCC|nr:Serine/threonine-protein kinase ifkB [Actinidia chinensis var. chinensis]
MLVDHRSCEYFERLENILLSRFEKDLSHSQSMITGKRGQTWPRKVPIDSNSANISNPNNCNGMLAGGSAVSRVHKAAFERDFPSLGTEERQTFPEIRRVSYPVLSTASQSLLIGTSAAVGGDGWTSALAEVPVLVGSNVTSGSVQQAILPTSASLASSTMTGLNMAETLAQVPSHSHATPPQSPSGTQRLEELAIKQSRQLIPMKPSMPKALVNPSGKPKIKIVQQQQQQQHTTYSHLTNHSPRSGPMKPEVSKMSSAGKLHVLKPARGRNALSPPAKDSSSSTSSSRVACSPAAVASSVVGSDPLRSPRNNPNLASAKRKPVMAILEKKSTPQAQSRSDFFNLMRKKSMTSPSSLATAVAHTFLDQSDGIKTGSPPVVPHDRDSPSLESFAGDQSIEKINDVKSNGNAFERDRESLNDRHQEPINNGKDHSSSNAILYSEEEEAAFLRSLGWEENTEEDEGLTEEEINSFYKEVDEYIKLKPSLRVLQGMQLKVLVPLNSHSESVGGDASPGSRSSDSKFES